MATSVVDSVRHWNLMIDEIRMEFRMLEQFDLLD